MKIFKIFLIITALMNFAGGGVLFTPETTVRTAMHLHSTYSYACTYSIEEIVARAKAKGLDAAIITDHDLIEVKYGIFPLRRVVRAGLELNSVFSEGVKKYFSDIENVQEKYPELLVIPGVETSPFYFWETRKRSLVLNDWHKHMLVFGLSSADMEKLPTTGNKNSWKYRPVLLWPFLLVLLGILFFKRAYLVKFGVVLIIAGGVFLANNYPFTAPEFDQYSGFKGSGPYQRVLDYVEKKGGFTVWAHPEADSNIDFPLISSVKGRFFNARLLLSTPPYPEVVTNTSGYNGICIIEEGYKTIGRCGGLWDKVLFEYSTGLRKAPSFAFGETDYRKEGAGIALDGVQNVVNSKKGDKKEFLKALKTGKFYVLKKGLLPSFPVLEEFSETGNVKISMNDGSRKKLTITLIKDGFVQKIADGRTPFSMDFKILVPEKGKSYYRLEAVFKDGSLIISNPVFIESAAAGKVK
ncbi:MAG: PHP domain-containing protein [Candidatus Firestonebacteria bacterium]